MRSIRLSRELFDVLAGITGESLVSSFLPTYVTGAEIEQNRIRLKNQLSEVQDQLEAVGGKKVRRLDTARALLDDAEFWEHQGRGLAIFIDDSAQTTPVNLVGGTSPITVVSHVFHLRPLLSSLQVPRLHTLVLSRKAVRLYRIGLYESVRVEVDLPGSFEEVNWFVDREKQRQQHPNHVSSPGGSRHGHEPAASRHEDLRRFLRAVADALPDRLHTEPLVVLGDDGLVDRFRSVHKGEVLSTPQSGLSDVDDVSTVQQKALPIITSLESSMRDRREKEALEALGGGGATTEIKDALEAAVAGRVGDILINRHAEPLWGRFEPSALRIDIHDRREPGDVDLFDRLVVHGMQTGAEVTIVDQTMEGHDFVAVLRF